MTRSINDVDRIIAPLHRGILRLNGNAFFPLKIHRVHGALPGLLVFTIGASCLKQLVDKGRFAVVNVGDNRDISNLFSHGCQVFIPCHLKNGLERTRTLLHFKEIAITNCQLKQLKPRHKPPLLLAQ